MTTLESGHTGLLVLKIRGRILAHFSKNVLRPLDNHIAIFWCFPFLYKCGGLRGRSLLLVSLKLVIKGKYGYLAINHLAQETCATFLYQTGHFNSLSQICIRPICLASRMKLFEFGCLQILELVQGWATIRLSIAMHSSFVVTQNSETNVIKM